MRRPVALALALLLVAVVAAPAEAVTVQRVFAARVGTHGANGVARISAYTNFTGSVAYTLKSLRKNTTYRVEIRKGRCGNVGAVVTALSNIRTNATGQYTGAKAVSNRATIRLWNGNWTSRLAIRFIAGASIRCGNLNFTAATRVRIPAQGVLNAGIDLPVVRGPNGYPYCRVAMYMGALNQPTEAGASFLFAHARKGMFLPLLKRSRIANGAALIGKSVYVYTSNSLMHTYKIVRVRRHVKSVQSAVRVTAEELWLQTSEGPNFTYPKLVIIAKRIGTSPATFAASHPTAKPLKCR